MLNINLNHVDPAHYHGWSGKLDDTHIDTASFQKRLGRKFETYNLADDKANISNVIKSIQELASVTEPGDLVVITYSGHGAMDSSSSYMEEQLTTDQAWCLYDGLLRDNHVHKLLSLFKKGVRVVLFSFCCHSGSMYKGGDFSDTVTFYFVPKFMPKPIEDKMLDSDGSIDAKLQKIGCKQDITASLKYIGACRNNQYSYSTGEGDAAQIAWWKSFDNFPALPYVYVFNNMFRNGYAPPSQTPVYQNLSKDKKFNNERAFNI